MANKADLERNLATALGETMAEKVLGFGKEVKLKPDEYLSSIIRIVREVYYGNWTKPMRSKITGEVEPGDLVKEKVWFDEESAEWVIEVPHANLKQTPARTDFIQACLGDGTSCWLQLLTHEIRLSEPEDGFSRADIAVFKATQAWSDTFNGGGMCELTRFRKSNDKERLNDLIESLNLLRVEEEAPIHFPRLEVMRGQASRILELSKSGEDTSGEIYWYFRNPDVEAEEND